MPSRLLGREQLERQLKLQQKPTTTAVPEKKVQEQRRSQQSMGRNGFMLGGVGLILLACVFGLAYLWSRWQTIPPVPTPSSSTPTIAELTSTLTPLPTETAVTLATAVSTTEAPPTKVNTSPQLFLPANISREGDTIGGAVISYQVSATDTEDGLISVDCAPRSGSLFSVGSTPVSCSATDSQGTKSTNSFTIDVKDTRPPTISSHADVSVQATSDSGATVSYSSPTAYDIVDGNLTPNCLPASGQLFKIGDTNVNCTVTDSHGNGSPSTTFVVHVTPVPDSSILVMVYWDRNNDGQYESGESPLTAALELYEGSACSGTVIATPSAFVGYLFNDLQASIIYCVKVINNSVEHINDCALVPRLGQNTKSYPPLARDQRYNDINAGFPYVCQ
jgi:cytoskeletal protein RodZ